MKVLTVDDNPTIRLIVRRYLEPLGLTVLEAGDGKDAVFIAHKEQPALLILDVNMPELDGQQTLEFLRHNPTTAHLPVLMLTADSTESLVLSLIRQGITDYIVKPFTRETLVSKVKKALRLDEHSLNRQQKGGGEPSGSLPQGIKILVLTDDEQVRSSVSRHLEGSAKVFLAEQDEEAIRLATEHVPQVLFLDLSFQTANAFDIFGRMLADERLCGSRFVAIANRNMTVEIANARRAGFHGILLNPFDQKGITQVIEQQNGWLVNLLT